MCKMVHSQCYRFFPVPLTGDHFSVSHLERMRVQTKLTHVPLPLCFAASRWLRAPRYGVRWHFQRTWRLNGGEGSLRGSWQNLMTKTLPWMKLQEVRGLLWSSSIRATHNYVIRGNIVLGYGFETFWRFFGGCCLEKLGQKFHALFSERPSGEEDGSTPGSNIDIQGATGKSIRQHEILP